MTNKEIKLELGKIALERCSGADLTASLKNVYEWIIEDPEEEIIPEQPRNDYELKSVHEVYCEMRRLEEDGKCTIGLATRFSNIARDQEIKTVGQLLERGKTKFMRLWNVGRSCADAVGVALKNLYGIEFW